MGFVSDGKVTITEEGLRWVALPWVGAITIKIALVQDLGLGREATILRTAALLQWAMMIVDYLRRLLGIMKATEEEDQLLAATTEGVKRNRPQI